MILITNEPLKSEGTNISVLTFRADTFMEIRHVVPEAMMRASETPRTFSDERTAFRSMLPMLKSRHPGEYVAVAGGRVVEHGPSRREVTRRFFDKYGRGPVYIGFVGPTRIIRQSSPFRTRPNASLS